MKDDYRSILVTGAFGRLGIALLREPVGCREKVVAFDIAARQEAIADISDRVNVIKGDITEITDLIRAVKHEKVNCIAHLAALVSVSMCSKNPLLAYKINVTGTINVLETARIMDVKKVVYASSIAVYSPGATAPMDEDYPKNPSTFYGTTKLAGELFGLTYADTYGIDFVALRFPLIYGPGSLGAWNPLEETRVNVKHFLGIKPWEILVNCLQRKPVVISAPQVGPSERVIDILYVKDAAKAITLALNATKLKHRVFNISSDEPLSINDIVQIAKKLIPDASIEVRSGDRPVLILNCARAKQELDYAPAYNFEMGFKDLMDSFLSPA